MNTAAQSDGRLIKVRIFFMNCRWFRLALFGLAMQLSLEVPMHKAQQKDESTVLQISKQPPEVQWHRSYGGSGEESHPHYVIETRDGDLVMATKVYDAIEAANQQ